MFDFTSITGGRRTLYWKRALKSGSDNKVETNGWLSVSLFTAFPKTYFLSQVPIYLSFALSLMKEVQSLFAFIAFSCALALPQVSGVTDLSLFE